MEIEKMVIGYVGSCDPRYSNEKTISKIYKPVYEKRAKIYFSKCQ